MDEIVPLLCPNCGQKTEKALRWLKNHHGAPILCAYCEASLGPEFAKLVAAIEDSEAREAKHFDKLKRGLGNKSEVD